MARLPLPGSDNGVWGDILNEYLLQAHKSDGTIKDNAVTSNTLAPNSVTNAALASGAVNAASIQDGSIVNTLIADGTIQEAKLSSSVQTKLNQTAPVTSVANKTGAVTLDKADVGLSNTDNTSDATKNSATATLTNKTINNARVDQFYDTNDNLIFRLPAVSGAVNAFYATNQSAGNYPTFGVDGNDTNIGIVFAPKNDAPVRIFAQPGVTPTIDVGGADSNVDLNLKTQGTGVVKANGVPVAIQVVTPPVTASSTGVAGQIAYDASYFYQCIATDTWKRSPLTTW